MPDDVRPLSSMDKMLSRAKERGREIRRRRRIRLGGIALASATLIAVLAGVGIARLGDDGEREARLVGLPIQTPEGAPTPSSEARETSPAPTPTPDPTTAPCRNSFDEACGPFRWDPEPPPNDPLEVAVTASPQVVKAGETVTFTVRATDDSLARLRIYRVEYGRDEGGFGTTPMCSRSDEERHGTRYGAWDPPVKNRQVVEETYQHTYETPGEYTAVFSVSSESPHTCGLPYDPYASTGTGSVTVTVEE